MHAPESQASGDPQYPLPVVSADAADHAAEVIQVGGRLVARLPDGWALVDEPADDRE